MIADGLVPVRLDADSMADLSAGLQALVGIVGEIDLGCQPLVRVQEPHGGVVMDALLRPDQLDRIRSKPIEGLDVVELAH
jgi:hypothetical protein